MSQRNSGIRRPVQGSFGAAKDMKKVNLNPKFSGVQSRLRTGKHAGNVKARVNRSQELFKRISRSTLAGLLRAKFDNEESIYELAPSETLSVTTIAHEDELKIKEDLAGHDFVILDLRSEEEYDARRVDSAVWCSSVDIKRDKYPTPVYLMKNKPGKILILYAEDEKEVTGAMAATMLEEKGWSNVFLLTGGLTAFEDKFPGCVVGVAGAARAVDLGDTTRHASSGRLSPRSTLARQQAQQGSGTATRSSYASSSAGSTRGGSRR